METYEELLQELGEKLACAQACLERVTAAAETSALPADAPALDYEASAASGSASHVAYSIAELLTRCYELLAEIRTLIQQLEDLALGGGDSHLHYAGGSNELHLSPDPLDVVAQDSRQQAQRVYEMSERLHAFALSTDAPWGPTGDSAADALGQLAVALDVLGKQCECQSMQFAGASDLLSDVFCDIDTRAEESCPAPGNTPESTAVLFCPTCGSPVQEGARFCLFCGSLLGANAAAPAMGPASGDTGSLGPALASSPAPAAPAAPSAPVFAQAASAPMPSSAPAPARKKPGLFGRIRDRIGHRRQAEDSARPTPASAPEPQPFLAPTQDPALAQQPEQLPASSPTVDDVRFVAVTPARLQRASYATLDLVMHEAGYEHAVDQVAAEHEGPTRTTDGGWAAAARGTQVRAELTSPELGNLGSEQGIWQGRYLRPCFTVPISSDAPQQVAFTAQVSFDGVPATRLRFVLACDDSAPRHLSEQCIAPERTDITSAFVSYASQDRQRVATIIQGMRIARPDLDIFFDVERLRSGQQWEQALRDEIGQSDVLFLCWSRSASQSKWVDFEWRYAYESKGEAAIEPVAIEPPSICPPPPELGDKHFNDYLLYVINAEG